MENIASSISLLKSLDEKLKELARQRGQTKNSLIQEAIREYVQKQEILKLEMKMQAKARALGIESEEDVVRLVRDVGS